MSDILEPSKTDHSKDAFLQCAALGSVPQAFGRAFPNSEIESFVGNHAQNPPVRSRAHSHEGVSSVYTRDDHGNDGSRIRRRGACMSTTSGDIVEDEPEAECSSFPIEGFDDMTPEEVKARGIKGLELAANPKQGFNYQTALENNYLIFPDDHADQANLDGYRLRSRRVQYIHDVPFFRKYGFSERGWKTYNVYSAENAVLAVAIISVGKATKDGKEYVAIVAHERFARYDANRYVMDGFGFSALDERGERIPQENVRSNAVPVSQLVYVAAKETGMLDGKPEKFFFVSEAITNSETGRDIETAVQTMEASVGKKLWHVLKKDGPGEEGELFKLLCGNDNNYSFLNTIGRNAETFRGYDVTSMEIGDMDVTMILEITKRTV
ncbi:hypothetical protein HYFRA_00011176 [Hymenoscyphus fraxineus]|uniref:Uncharacterized protein n=1 Tax=Hymenoscyphus fraxineus TaxID=746836 RepID=A0A9N9L4C4_9HELO|nr:hypothetical protein HYFRA_00011176 [Hymenoscyphus fraxineus]